MANNIMSQSVSQLRRWRANRPVDHRQLNEPVDVLNDMIRGVRGPRQIVGSPIGAPAALSGTAQFRLKNIPASPNPANYADHLVCRTWDGTMEGDTDVLVAKPWSLRQTPFDNQTHNGIAYDYTNPSERTASKGGVMQKEIVIPPYVWRDIIYATAAIQGGTGVVVAENPVVWLEDNRDSRAWARAFDQ